ncbi:MAG TPA: hypothetical protein DEO32_04865 [Ruminococcaceae bacterium]|nr:hypothetical protein [Oscillospiraceae bacterium]
MKYCKKCGKTLKNSFRICPSCGSNDFVDTQSEEYLKISSEKKKETDILSQKKKRRRVMIVSVIIGILILLGMIFAVLDTTGVIPTGLFGQNGVLERYIDDDGDARSRESDEKVIRETVSSHDGGEDR